MEIGPFQRHDERRGEPTRGLAPGVEAERIQERVVRGGVVASAAHHFGQHHGAEGPAEFGQRLVHLGAEPAPPGKIDHEGRIAPVDDGAEGGDRVRERVERGGSDRWHRGEERGEATGVDPTGGERPELRARPVGAGLGIGGIGDHERLGLRQGVVDEGAELGDGTRHRREDRCEARIRRHSGRAPCR